MKDILNQKKTAIHQPVAQQPRQNMQVIRKSRLTIEQPQSNRQKIKNIDAAFNTFAPSSNRIQAQNNYYLFRRQKAERNKILTPHPQTSVSFSNYEGRPERSFQTKQETNNKVSLIERTNEKISSGKPQNSQRQKRVDNSSKPPFVVSRKVSEKKRVKISESAYSKAKEYGKKVNGNLSNNSINSSIEKRSSTAASSSCNRRESTNSSFKQNRAECLRIQTVPQSRTHNYYQSKRYASNALIVCTHREIISNRFLEEQRQIRAARKQGLTNVAPKFLEGAKYTRPSSEAGSRSHSIQNSGQMKQTRGISHECLRKNMQHAQSKEGMYKYGSPLRVKNDAVSHFNPAPSEQNKRIAKINNSYANNAYKSYNNNSIGSRESYIRSQSSNVSSNKQVRIVGRKINNMTSELIPPSSSSSLAKRYNIPSQQFGSQEPVNSYSYMRPTSSSQANQSQNISNQIALKSQARNNIAKRIGGGGVQNKAKIQSNQRYQSMRAQNYAVRQQKENRINSQQNNQKYGGDKEKLKKTKCQLYNIINRLSSHLKICNNFAKELEKIEF